MKRKIVLLTAIMILACVSGIWLLVSPSFEKQALLDRQQKLLAELEVDHITLDISDVRSIVYDGDNEPDIIFTTASDVAALGDIAEISATPNAPIIEIGSGIGILEIEKINLKLPVVEGVTEECLKTATGHVLETPPIGDNGNAVIAGHRSYTYGKYFNRLGEMENGDVITYTPIDGESMQFEVFEIIDTEPGDQIAFIQPQDKSIITLYTCTPVRTATHRLLVRAVRTN